MNVDYDVLIIGGGMVGASLACALTEPGLRVGLVEMSPLAAMQDATDDDRVLALAFGTRRIFEGLGIWERIAARSTPIHQIHISERGCLGVARFDRRDEGVDALGYVAEATAVAAALASRLESRSGLEMWCPASLDTVTVHSEAVRATVTAQGATQVLTARLLVAADGAQSRVRQQLGIRALQWDYGQTAVIASVTPALPHRNVAFERFTEPGPVALLPLSEGRCGVVCTDSRERADAVMKLSDTEFLAFFQDRFGERLGRFLKAGRRQSYPLYMTKSLEHVRPRVAVIGNAAHTLHPIAGQGFNLGLRDVAALADAVVDAWCQERDVGGRPVLASYTSQRRGDQWRSLAFTDGLARLFVNRLAPVRLARNLGLLAFDLLPPAKHLLARQTMGQLGMLPRLARGLSLPGRGRA